MKIEGVPDGYELVRFGSPSNGDSYLSLKGIVKVAAMDFVGDCRPIVRKIEPPKPIEPPQGYRLLTEDDTILLTDKWWHFHKYWDDLDARSHSLGHKWNPVESTPMCRKIEPKVRPMTRAEFLAAWKQRGFCPLINPDGEIDVVVMIVEELDHDMDCVNMHSAGWCSVDDLADYKFASDETYLTVEE